MRERGASNLATILLAAVAALVVSVLLMDWVVVDVRTEGEDRVHVVVPVPLGLVRAALAFAPDEEMRVEVPAEARRYREPALKVMQELEAVPDGTTLVAVNAPDAKVTIRKERGRLLLDVHADDATVHGALPVEAVARALQRWDWKRADPRLALDVLAAAGPGQILSVDAPDARVRISTW
jgi:hypothetical protein